MNLFGLSATEATAPANTVWLTNVYGQTFSADGKYVKTPSGVFLNASYAMPVAVQTQAQIDADLAVKQSLQDKANEEDAKRRRQAEIDSKPHSKAIIYGIALLAIILIFRRLKR